MPFCPSKSWHSTACEYNRCVCVCVCVCVCATKVMAFDGMRVQQACATTICVCVFSVFCVFCVCVRVCVCVSVCLWACVFCNQPAKQRVILSRSLMCTHAHTRAHAHLLARSLTHSLTFILAHPTRSSVTPSSTHKTVSRWFGLSCGGIRRRCCHSTIATLPWNQSKSDGGPWLSLWLGNR